MTRAQWLRAIRARLWLVGWGALLMLAGAVLIFVIGALFGAYWPELNVFVRDHGILALLLKYQPLAVPIVAISVFSWQVKRARYNQRIDLILKLAERFEKSEMREVRAKAAQYLRFGREGDSVDVEYVLNYFEEVGFLYCSGAVDRTSIYEFFSGWIVPYYQASENYRKDRTEFGPGVYDKFARLIDALVTHELAMTGELPWMTPSRLAHFLEGEAAILPKPKQQTLPSRKATRKTRPGASS